MTSPSALRPERNATTPIAPDSIRSCPNVPSTQYLKNRISKRTRDAKNMTCAIRASAMAVYHESKSADANTSCSKVSPLQGKTIELGGKDVGTRMKNMGSPARTAAVNNKLNPLFGSFWGALKVCVISGLGCHRSGGSGFDGEASPVIGLTVAKANFNGLDSPNEAMTRDSCNESA